METTAIAILAVVLLFTAVLWFMMLFMGKRQTWMLVFTSAITLVAILVCLNVCGVVEIWSLLTPAETP